MSAFPSAVFFVESSSFHCKEFLPGEAGMDAICCGAPTQGDSSYCPTHHAVNFQPLKKTRDGFIAAGVEDNWHVVSDHEPDLTELLS